MALTNNPNLSRGIEKRWRGEINKRWRRFSDAVIPRLSGIASLTLNVDNQQQKEIDDYISAFEVAMLIVLLGDWQNKYQTDIYVKTAERAEAQYKARSDINELDRSIAAILQALFDNPPQVEDTHANELDFLKGRANDKLSAVVKEMSGKVRQLLNDNIDTTTGTDLAELIEKELGLSKTSARRIAQTEITQAAQRSVINTADVITKITGVEQAVIWITVNDSKVRHLHAEWHGKEMTPAQAKKNASISPWNCRCGFRIVPADSLTDKEVAEFKRERSILLNKDRK